MTFVYVVGPDDPGMDLPTPPIKIGKAVCPYSRLRTLQTGSPQKLAIYALWHFDTPARAFAVESACHRNFKQHRLNGEWFQIKSDDVLRFVGLKMKAQLNLCHYQPHH